MGDQAIVELPECVDCNEVDYETLGYKTYKGKTKVWLECQMCGRQYLLGALFLPVAGTGVHSQEIM